MNFLSADGETSQYSGELHKQDGKGHSCNFHDYSFITKSKVQGQYPNIQINLSLDNVW